METPPIAAATFMTPRGSVPRPLRPVVILAVVVLVTASLYWARAVLIPIALAMLLTFVLSPLTVALQRRVGRLASVAAIVILAFSLLGGGGWALSQEVSSLASDVPKYSAGIQEKLARWRRNGTWGFLGRVRSSVDDVTGEIQKATEPPGRQPPTPVVIRGAETGLLTRAAAVLEPLATAGLVGLLVVFMLLERIDLRNRFIRLIGYGRVTVTTKALDEAADRISRYLLVQCLVNAGMGLVFGLGLVLIGVPYGFLWGALLGILRFVPYVGIWLAVIPPLLLSLAVFDGAGRTLLVLVLFIALEAIVSGAVEPVVYSHRAGVSKVALLCSIAFWTWLWGPVGLILATPLTVCLVVFAKHVPAMAFVGILMSDEPVLETTVGFYQRLVAGDEDEAGDIVEAYARTHPAEQVYDRLLVPALVAAKRDRLCDRISEEDEMFIRRATRDFVDEVAPPRPRSSVGAAAGGQAPIRVLGCPGGSEADEIALHMLGTLVDPDRLELEVVSADVLSSEIVALVERTRPAIVCLATLPPGGLAQTRYRCKRLRALRPDLKIVVGRWGVQDDDHENRDVLRSAGADHVGATLLETRDQLAQLAPLAAADRTTAA